MPAKIVVVGSFNADLVTYAERLPARGETVNGRRFVTGPGGKGSNQAVAAARLGADVTFIGRVGRDAFANIGLELWKREGINTDYVARDDQNATGIAAIAVEDSGENTIIVTLGANLAIRIADLDAAENHIASADALITQLEINLDAVQHALALARKHGVRTILNPAPASPLPPELLGLVDYLTPNENELQIVARRNNVPIEEAARSLLTSPAQTIVVTLGSKGAGWFRQDGSGIVAAYPVRVVDTVGAGDAFNAGLAVGLAEGRELPAAIAFANGTAAVSVTRPGAAASMPQRHEVESLLNRNPK